MTIAVPAYLLVVAFLATPVSVLLGALTGAWITQRSRSGAPIIPPLHLPRITRKEPKAPPPNFELPKVGA